MCTSKRSQSPANEWIFFFSSNFEPHRLLRDVRRADDPATHQRVVENKFGSCHFGALFSGWIPNQFSELSASHEMFDSIWKCRLNFNMVKSPLSEGFKESSDVQVMIFLIFFKLIV